VIGLLTGTVVGAGLMTWFASRTASEVRERLTDSARSLGAAGFRIASACQPRVGETIDDLTRKAAVAP
jgi:hypothetical protein